MAGFAEHSDDAARAAEGLLDWAERDARLRVHYSGLGCVFKVDGQRLLGFSLDLRIDRSLQVDLVTLSRHDPERWDQQSIDDLKRELDIIGVGLKPYGASGWKHPKAPLESLAKDEPRRKFQEVMETVAATLVD